MYIINQLPSASQRLTTIVQIMNEIIQRTADAMVSEGMPFQGVLFAGLMIKDGKAKLLEHNVRFGDPEVQCLMMRLKSDLLATLLNSAKGNLEGVKLEWSEDAALTVVMAAKGYPGAYDKGSVIHINEERLGGCKVFHAGTARSGDGELVANGGRVLAVTAAGRDVCEARAKAYEAVAAVDWKDGFYRKDIGWRAVSRACTDADE
jgi:phosphoribosylamine--glycine ligase